MVDEAGVKTEGARTPGKRQKTLLMGGVLLGVMLLEGGAVFLAVRHLSGGPVSAHGEGIEGLKADEGVKAPLEVEVEVTRFRAQSDKAQRVQVYDLTVYAVVRVDRKEELTASLERKSATIKDRFSSVVRAADPERFMEPDLATLRQRLQAELNEILGDVEIVQQILIPSIVAYGDG